MTLALKIFGAWLVATVLVLWWLTAGKKRQRSDNDARLWLVDRDMTWNEIQQEQRRRRW